MGNRFAINYQKSLIISSIVVTGLALLPQSRTFAQIIPDQTLPRDSAVLPQGNTSVIVGGTTVGSNLFHSFQQFSVNPGTTAYFNNSLDVQNIFSRVTGSSVSEINGLIRANGSANLFLINPKGILFGPGASLDIGGSFVASTADSLSFADGTEFSARNPTAAPLLTVSVPVGLQYGGGGQSINVQGANLAVKPGASLVLAGGNVNVDSALLTAPDGRFEVGAATAGSLSLTFSGSGVGLRAPLETTRADVVIRNSRIDVSADQGGSISISAQNLDLINSRLENGTGSRKGEDIFLNVIDKTLLNASLISAFTSGEGSGGNVTISTGDLLVQDGSLIETVTRSSGNGGLLTINASDFVSLTSSLSNSLTGIVTEASLGGGNAGDLIINTKQLTLSGKGIQIFTQTLDQGNGGSLTINASDLIHIKNTFSGFTTLFTGLFANTSGIGNGGYLVINTPRLSMDGRGTRISVDVFKSGDGADLTINTEKLLLQDGAFISARLLPSSRGDGGDITINAKDSVVLNSLSSIIATNQGLGKGSDLYINTGQLSIDLAAIGTTTTLNGNSNTGGAGNIFINATNSVILNQGTISTNSITFGGKSGDIIIYTKELRLDDSSIISTGTQLGLFEAGNISINATDSVTLTGDSLISSSSLDGGNSGNITINTGTLIIDDSRILTIAGLIDESNSSTNNLITANAGNIIITANDSIVVIGRIDDFITGISSSSNTKGNSGNIQLNTKHLLLQDSFIISGSDRGENGGNITINADNSITLSGISSISAATNSAGQAGNVMIITDQLLMQDAARINTQTFVGGDGGNIEVFAGLIRISGDASIKSSSQLGTGNAGDIKITTDLLQLLDSAQILSETLSEGRGGSIQINADTVDVMQQSTISVQSLGSGDAGDIFINTNLLNLNGGSIVGTAGTQAQGNGSSVTINANQFTATNGGNITTSTSGASNAGSITLNIANNLTLTGADSGLFANTEAGSTGNGGSIFVDPNTVTINDGAAISVNSQGSGTGGNIILQTGSLSLDKGSISAATTTSDGGNITLHISDLAVLTQNSQISASAGGLGNGGNLSFDTRFLIVNGNSDISANAFQGNGGNIQINTQGIFLSPDSTITASSKLGIDGNVQLNTLDIDPSKGLTALPENVVDASDLVAQRCSNSVAKNDAQSEFVHLGSGGVPPNPSDPLESEAVLTGWAILKPNAETTRKLEIPTSKASTFTTPTTIVEAQGWMLNSEGNVVLTAEPASGVPHFQSQSPLVCREL